MKMYVLIDAHVHIYDCFDLGCFFDSALENFSFQARKLGEGTFFVPVLCMTEGKRDNWFGRLNNWAEGDTMGLRGLTANWSIERTGESSSLKIKGEGGEFLFVIAGRQIETAERLEVLAIGTNGTFGDGNSLGVTVRAILDSGGIPVIPWGFGKWYGERGRILKKFIETTETNNYFLGDNSGRPPFLPYPHHFLLGEKRGIRILPGSDPLPFPSESSRPGNFGFTINGTIDHAKPADDMKKIILDPATRFTPFGQLEKFSRFLRNQWAMQIRKRNAGEGRNLQ